jgi:hypothetical protein
MHVFGQTHGTQQIRGFNLKRHAVAQLVEALLYNPTGRGFDSPCGHMDFFIDIILPAELRS